MYIKQIINQHRRDFTAIYACEHCHHSYQSFGYDDDNFHRNVVPNMTCDKCGRIADGSHPPRLPRYPESQTL